MAVNLDFQVHPGQQAILNSSALYKVVTAGRRFGKTFIAAILCIIEGLKEVNDRGHRLDTDAEVMYMAPTFEQAKGIFWPVLKRLAEPATAKIHENTGVLTLINGVRIRLKGMDAPDRARGFKLRFAVLDEYADMHPGAWDAIIQPALMDVEGGALFIGCVTADTLILGEQGLEEIGTCPVGYTDEDKRVYGLGGWHKAENRYGNPALPTKRLRTRAGIELEATPNHRVWTPDGWRRMDELRPGDPLYLQHDQQVYGTEETDDDWAYFLGLYLAEGSSEPGIYRTTISIGDQEVHDWLRDTYGFKQVDKFHSRLNSKEFHMRLLRWFPDAGAAKAPQKVLSKRVLRLQRRPLCRLLSGYFDGDGTAHKSRKRVSCVTSSKRLSEQLQALLLNMGMRAARSTRVTPPTERVAVASTGYRVTLEGDSAVRFMQDVGFRLGRKQRSWARGTGHQYWFDRRDFAALTAQEGYIGRCRKVTRKTLDRIDPKEAYDRQLLADEVAEVTDSRAATFDFCIPDTHSYFTNGVVSHNTPKGKNHFYELFVHALKAERDVDGFLEWEAFKFTSRDNPFLTDKALGRMYNNERYSSDLLRQELEADFLAGSGGLLPPDWWQFDDREPKDGHFVVTVDLQGFTQDKVAKKKVLKDNSVITIAKICQKGWWIKEQIVGKWDVRKTALQIVLAARKCQARVIGIERGMAMNAVGPYMDDYMKEFRSFFKVEALSHGNQHKEDRIRWAIQGRLERGRIILNCAPDAKPWERPDWVNGLIDEASDFPNPATPDDRPDSLAYVDQVAKPIHFDMRTALRKPEYDDWAPLDDIAGY